MRLVEYVISEVEHQWQGGESARWELLPEALLEIERGSALVSLFMQWREALPAGGGLPQKSDFDPRAELEKLDWGVTHEYGVIRIKGGQGGDVSTRQTGYQSIEDVISNPRERAFLEYELRSVILNAAPRYHHVDQIIDGQRSYFSRLLLPVVGPRGDVTEVVLAENHKIDVALVREGL